jgi:ubiquinone/menaquinone biosynthesis C-methylase UbiE
MRVKQYCNEYKTKIEFLQADILNLNTLATSSIDIIGSDAVFEHINKFSEAMIELARVLRYDGLLYANFGPLWYCWGGDHISGRDDSKNAYNHIRLNKVQYNKYLDSFGDFSHSEHDGRTWIQNNLFSYLKPKEYLDILTNQELYKLFVSCTIDERAVQYKKLYPKIYNELVEKFQEENLLISGMTIIYKK